MIEKLITYFVKNKELPWIFLVVVVVLGLFSFSQIKKSRFPELHSHTILVDVVYPGAAPQEIEEGIVLKIEEAFKGIEGIEEVKSVSTENTAKITVTAFQEYDTDLLLMDVKNAVDRINSFPVDAEKPVVFKQKRIDRVMELVIYGDADLFTLKKIAEEVETDFMNTDFISQVQINGLPAVEISIEVSEETLLRYGLTFQEIGAAVAANNIDISGGTIKTETEEIKIRANAKADVPEKIGQIILRTNEDGLVLRIRDVAKIFEQFADVPNSTLYNGENAVGIKIQKLANEDILEITDSIRSYVENYNEHNLKTHIAIVEDQSIALKQRIDLLLNNGGVGLLLVLICLGLFLNLRLSFWVAWGIPFSLLGMFIIGSFVGITINLISLFGMILIIGILVDDGIVVGENIYHEMEKGRSGYKAAVKGTMDVLPAVYTSVITTIIAFIPFFFLSGRVGEIVQEMSIVVIACLIFSLIECTFILPSHLSKKIKIKKKGAPMDGVLKFLRTQIYRPSLELVVKFRYVVLAGLVAFFMIIIGLFQGGLIQVTFFPGIENDETSMSLVLKPGTPKEQTEKVLKGIDKLIWEVNEELRQPEVILIKNEKGIVIGDSLPPKMDSIIIGTLIKVGSSGLESGSHAGTIDVSFLDAEHRWLSATEIENALRDKIGEVEVAEKFTISGNMIFGKPVEISLTSDNLEELVSAKDRLKEELNTFVKLKDVSDNYVKGNREVQIELKPRAFLLGLNHREVTRQIRQGFFGEEVQRLQKGTDEVKVWVRYPEFDRSNLAKLDQMKIKTANGDEFPFSEIATYKLERAVVAINHYHSSREIRVTANLHNSKDPVPQIMEEIETQIMPEILARFPSLNVSYEGQAKESKKFGSSAIKYFGLAFFAIFIVILINFRSPFQAIIILLMIPFGVAGGIIGHRIHGFPVSILSMWGLLALSGIVINDGVVLVHRFNQFIKEGKEINSAVIAAGLSRFRAILLTSITTSVGLFPLISQNSRQAQFLIPMAVSVAYGVAIGTVFILFALPVFLLVLNDIRRFIYWMIHNEWPEGSFVEAGMKDVRREQKIRRENPEDYRRPGFAEPIEVEFLEGPDPDENKKTPVKLTPLLGKFLGKDREDSE